MTPNVLFTYRALDREGGDVVGSLEAADEKDAFDKLSSRGLAPYEFKAKRDRRALSFLQRQSITKKDLSGFLRQFATLLSANVTIVDGLSTLARSRAHPALADRTRKVITDIRAGAKLSVALENNLSELPDYVIRLADLGEATGSLGKALSDAADRLEYELSVRADIRSALTYPLFLLIFGGMIVVAMFTFVVPRFADLLGDNLADAPAISRMVIGAGLWMQSNAPFAIAGALAIVAAAIAAFRNQRVGAYCREQAEKLPIAGAFLRQTECAVWCRTVGVALVNRAQLVDALRLGETGARSPAFRRNLERVRRQVRAGRPLEEALGDAVPDFDAVVIDLIRTGRNAGALGDMLLYAAAQFEGEARERAKRLTALAEPVAVAGIAVIVAAVVISIVLAMTSLYTFEF